MLKVLLREVLDLSSSCWVRTQRPSVDMILGRVSVLSFGIENGQGWIIIDDDELPKLEGLSYSVQPAPSDLPKIVIVNMVCDKIDAVIVSNFTDITCKEGSVLTCTAELRSGDGAIIPVSDSFRMPLKSSDGRERFVFVAFESGIATFSGVMNESGLWSINQETINSRLPSEKHMAMEEVSIYVCI